MLAQSDNWLPREYLGQARLLLQDMQREGKTFSDTVMRLWLPLKARYLQHHKVRSELLAGAVRDWRLMPARFRLGDPLIEHRNTNLNIAEFRLLTGDLFFDHWKDEHEYSIAIELCSIVINRKECSLRGETYGTIGIHALGRRYERSRLCSTDDILADVKAIVSHYDSLIQRKEFTVPCRSGFWKGEVVSADFQNQAPPRKVLCIRTFIGEG